LVLFILAILLWFKGFRFEKIIFEKNKKLIYPLISIWIVVGIFSGIVSWYFKLDRGYQIQD